MIERSKNFVRVVVALLAFASSSAIADDGLRMENALPIAPPRDGGPIYLMGELQWDRPELLEGRLRYVLRDGREILSVVETDPLAAVAGNTRFRQLLPVQQTAIGFGMSDIDVSFVTEDEEFDLREIGVRLPQSGEWDSVVLCAEPRSGAGLGGSERLREAIPLEEAFGDAKRFGIQTYAPTIPALDFPEQSLAYCAFDAVLLPPGGFARLNGRQLAAIADWVRAGGVACIGADETLEAKQIEFLDHLFRDAAIGPPVRDEEGRLIEPVGTRDGIFARRVGVGYAVLLFKPAAELDFESAAWKETHARFWRLRERLVERRQGGSTLDRELLGPPNLGELTRRPATPVYNQYGYPQDPRSWTFTAPAFGTAIVHALRPSDIRLLPGWAVLLILFGYVAIVGPLDYVVLGRLGLRKWTWLTFPAVTLAVTWGVVATADAFMSDNDHQRAVEIIDLDANGEPVRRTRLELLFRGSSEPVLHELNRSFFARLAQAHFGTPNVYDPMRSQVQTIVSNDAPTGPYVGTLPSRYVVPQRVAKWTPQVNRSFEIAPEIDVPAIDWAKLASGVPAPISFADGRTGYAMRVGADGASGPAGPLGQVQRAGQIPYVVRDGAPIVLSRTDVSFVEAATAAAEQERFGIQFQRSPLGLGRLDDLPFADATNGGDAALAVWVQDADGNITIYRKLVTQQ